MIFFYREVPKRCMKVMDLCNVEYILGGNIHSGYVAYSTFADDCGGTFVGGSMKSSPRLAKICARHEAFERAMLASDQEFVQVWPIQRFGRCAPAGLSSVGLSCDTNVARASSHCLEELVAAHLGIAAELGGVGPREVVAFDCRWLDFNTSFTGKSFVFDSWLGWFFSVSCVLGPSGAHFGFAASRDVGKSIHSSVREAILMSGYEFESDSQRAQSRVNSVVRRIREYLMCSYDVRESFLYSTKKGWPTLGLPNRVSVLSSEVFVRVVGKERILGVRLVNESLRRWEPTTWTEGYPELLSKFSNRNLAAYPLFH